MDDFSDDDFDDLNANALQELENKAIQFTQAKRFDATQQQRQPQPQQVQYIDDYDDDDIDDSKTSILPPEKTPAAPSSKRIPRQPAQNAWGPVPIPASHLCPQAVASASRPSAPTPLASRPSQARLRYSQIRPPLPPPRPPPAIQSRYQPSQVRRPTALPNYELAALQAQIWDLNERIQTKDGEILIVRQRLEKYKQDHERELQTLKKQTQEQIAKQQQAVDVAKAAERNATTELEFARQDWKEEQNRAKRRDGGGTPKKPTATKSWGVADGFEDVEMATSPSKGNRRRNDGAVANVVSEPPARLTRTPTKGRRKRPAAVLDSPIMELETTDDVMDIDGLPNNVTGGHPAPIPPIRPLPFDYLKVILNHSAAYGRPLTFDVLSGYSFPSNKTESLASILFQKLAIMGNPSDPLRLPIDFCEQVIDLWQRCVKEAFYVPISELVSLVSFTLHLNTVGIAPHIASCLLDVAAQACMEVSIPRLTNQSTNGDPTHDGFINLQTNIPTTNILAVVYLTALGCATAPPTGGSISSPIADFWSNVHVKFVAMLLNPRQPVDDVLAMLKLLRTAVFEDSIGPLAQGENAEEIASVIIGWVSLCLIETWRRDIDHDTSILLKTTVLRTLTAFARSPFGMRQLAQHEWAIPRLVYLLSNSIDELYDGNSPSRLHIRFPSSPPSDNTAAPEASELQLQQQHTDDLQMLIENTMLLLHTIMTSKENAGTIDPKAKLAKLTGGNQKYLLSLARLNFSEDAVSEETAELAHELLERLVTEEEGDELGVFFGG